VCKTTYSILDDRCTVVAFERVIVVYTCCSYRCHNKEKDEVILYVLHFFVICSC
jgi:hypothetical protein